MKPSLKTVLRESHVAIIAIAMLLGQGVMLLFQIAWIPIREAIAILIDAIEYPYVGLIFKGIFSTQFICQVIYASFSLALPCFVVAWIVSRFVFSAGPFEALIAYRARICSND